MSVIIVREMVGTSPQSWSDAARQAVATAARTVRNIKTIEVVKSTARVEDGLIIARAQPQAAVCKNFLRFISFSHRE